MGRCDLMKRAADSQIYIKDVKSSNGTFINGDRLSPEGVESEPRELHNEDLVVSQAGLLRTAAFLTLITRNSVSTLCPTITAPSFITKLLQECIASSSLKMRLRAHGERCAFRIS